MTTLLQKLAWILIAYFIVVQASLAHKQHVHQYFVREGYRLLRMSISQDVPQMVNHIGWQEGYSGVRPWSTGLISDGAWLEDDDDPVYLLSRSNPPTVSGGCLTLANVLNEVFGNDNNEPYTSSTHFWNPDNGDASNPFHEGTIHPVLFPPCYGSHYSFTVPSAYQKFLKYANGGWDLPIMLALYCFPTRSDGSGCCANQYAIVHFRYNGLRDLRRNGAIYVTKVTWMNGQETIYNQPIRFWPSHWSSLNGQTYAQFMENLPYEILGRMVHLLTDMSVPAHTRVDDHGKSDPGIRHDSYEQWYGNQFQTWDAQSVYSQSGGPLNPYDFENGLHFLMYTTAQLANYFGSNGPYNGGGNSAIGGNPRSDESAYLQPILANLLTHIDGIDIRAMREDNQFTENIKSYIRDKTLPHTVRATAGFVPFDWSFANNPNPFNPTTRITFSLPKDGSVSLVIYDVQGREVVTLVESYREAGYYSATWDSRNNAGVVTGSGVYFARLNVANGTGGILFAKTIKLLLTK